MRQRWWLMAAAVVPLAVSGFAALAPAAQAGGASARAVPRATGPGAGGSTTGLAAGNPFCKKLGKTIQASSGAQIFCFGAQKVTVQPHSARAGAMRGAPRNVDAASFAEDVSPAGARGYGQSETSVGASGRYVVEAWNDSTGFFSRCGNTSFKEETTGLGFSVNGGRTFRDLGGLRNPGCQKNLYEGDPNVTAYVAGGHTYFYVSSLYLPVTGLGKTFIAFDPCEVMGSGTGASLHCGRPVIAASSTQCFHFSKQFVACSFLDKDYMAVDPARGRLYVTYSDFPVIGAGNPEDMSVCDLGNRAGQAGPAGGTPAHPVCEHGTPLVRQPGHQGRLFAGSPYMTIAGKGRGGCENEGSYPAVDAKSGAVYVAYEYNWASNLSPFCGTVKTKTKDIMTVTPRHCLRLAPTAACARPSAHNGDTVISLTSAFVPGYNRFPVSDFPRPVVSDRYGTVSMAWNDTRFHPNGDVLLQSFHLGSLKKVQRTPVVLDVAHHDGLTMMPAVRAANPDGTIDVAWYSRASAATADTSVRAATGVNPRTTRTPRRNVTITNVASNWLLNVSDIVPNFGDYIDAAVSATGHWPYVGGTVYFAWSDGRAGVPQPYEAHLRAG